MKKPILYMMIGLPAAGKSSFASRIPHAVIVCADEIRGEWFGDEGLQYTEEFLKEKGVDYAQLTERQRRSEGSKYIWKEVFRRIDELLDQGKDVVLDGVNVTRRLRISNLDAFRDKAWICGVFFNTDIDICIARDAQRSRVVGEARIREFAEQLDIPEISEGFDALYTFDGYGKLQHLELKAGVPKELFPE